MPQQVNKIEQALIQSFSKQDFGETRNRDFQNELAQAAISVCEKHFPEIEQLDNEQVIRLGAAIQKLTTRMTSEIIILVQKEL